MNRRDALSRVALIMGGTIIGAEAFLSGCKTSPSYGASLKFTPEEIAYLNEIAETIIPKTNTPGAKDAQVGEFMQIIVNDCYEEKDQKIFLEGMGKLDKACKDKQGKGFVECTPEQRKEFLIALDKEAKDYQKKKEEFDKKENAKEAEEKAKGNTYKKEEMPNHYFPMMKQLTLWGFFTSKPGATQALRYEAVPGRYDGCIPYKKGDKAWAT